MAAHPWEKSYPPGIHWNVDFPVKPLYSVLDETIARFPDNRACDFMGKTLTYAQLGELVNRAAKGFQSLGVGRGSKVGLFLPNTPHYLIAFFGVLKAGGTVVNYSPLDAERELAHKIDDSGTEIMVTLGLQVLYPQMAKMLGRTKLRQIVVGQLQEMLPFPKNLLYPLAKKKDIAKVPSDDRHVPWKQLLNNDGRHTPVPLPDLHDEVAVLQYTGGTTGTPKGAMLTHANLVAAAEQYTLWGLGDEPVLDPGHDRTLVVLPMFHIYALTVVMMVAVRNGSEMILHPRFELEAVVKDIDKKKPTILSGVPTMYMAIMGYKDLGKYDVSSLKFCTSGGAPLPVEVLERFEGLTGCKLVEGWGMTETCAPGCSVPVIGKRKLGSAGVPLPGTIMEIVDLEDPNKVLGAGEKGEICIRGPQVMKGYWNRPEETEEAFSGGRFHTGDIGYIDEDGFVFIVDRKKDMIISGGYNVFPRNIEDAIYEHPSVEEVTVIGVPDEYRGQSAKAFVKLRAGAPNLTLEELKEFLRDKLGKHEMPQALEIRDALPKTLIGKLSKKELVEEERKKAEAAKSGAAVK